MKVLICGGRDFNDVHRVDSVMDTFRQEFNIDVVVHGDARGADTLGKQWAMSRGIYAIGIPALWDYFSAWTAGPLRNQAMIDLLEPDICVAFPGHHGTADMIQRCKDHGIKIMEIAAS